jgi:hypothetical protein
MLTKDFQGFMDFFKDPGGAIKTWWAAVVQAFDNALSSIGGIMGKIKDLIMKALNPFAKGSPSLVENVQAGISQIKAEYASLACVTMPNFSSIAPATTQNYNTTTTTNQPQITQTNSFNVTGEANAKNIMSYAAFQLEHLGMV